MTGAPPVALGQGMRIQLHVSGTAAGSRPRLDVDLHLPGRGVTAIFGPSGAGKSTLLRAIAGLVPAQGTVVVGGRAWQTPQWQLPAHRRPIGYVFQQAALFPHLRVSGNLRYAAKRAGPEAPDWAEVVEQLELADLLERRPQTLSGGERQRVAIARALLIGPELLLMDEPLSALDADRREQLLPYLDRLRRELAIPILYVTHRRYEVGRLADDVVALNDGRAAGPEPVAAWLPAVSAGAEAPAVLIEAQIVEQDRSWGLARAVFDGGMFWVDGRHGRVGDRLRLQSGQEQSAESTARHARVDRCRHRSGGSAGLPPGRLGPVSGTGHTALGRRAFTQAGRSPLGTDQGGGCAPVTPV